MDSMFYPELGGDAIGEDEFQELQYALGMRRRDNYGNEYEFVKYTNGAGDVEAGIGDLIVKDHSAADSHTVSADLTEANSGLDGAGLAASVFDDDTDKIYGWAFKKGSLKTAMNGAGISATTDGGVGAGDILLVTVGGTDKQLDSVAPDSIVTGTFYKVGHAYIADATNDLTEGKVDFDNIVVMKGTVS